MASDFSQYQRLLDQPIQVKVDALRRGSRPRHVLFAHQFDRRYLERVGRTAEEIRILSRASASANDVRDLLSHKRAMLYFTQTSTRTFLSFLAACQLLGLSTAEIRDPSISSEYKGESRLDSIRMFSSYSDLIIMRDASPQFAECCAYLMDDIERASQRSVPIINGGSGADEHPTQALLDVFTIQRSFGLHGPLDTDAADRFQALRDRFGVEPGLENKTYTFVGDIGRGRTVRSLCILLSNYSGITCRFVSPPREHLQLDPWLRAFLKDKGVEVSEHDSLDEVIEDSDVVYMTRIQREHDTSATSQPTTDELGACQLTEELVQRMPAGAIIMHPFPRNEEIPTSIDHDERVMYFHQARNGMWIRAALIANVCDVDRDVSEIFESYTGDRKAYAQVH